MKKIEYFEKNSKTIFNKKLMETYANKFKNKTKLSKTD